MLEKIWKERVKIEWIINLIGNLNKLIEEEKDLSHIILKNVFTKENLVKSILQTI